MIELVLSPEDLGRVRFAHSPVRELVASLRTLQDPGRAQVYGSWLAGAKQRLGDLDLELLTALAPLRQNQWNFLMPPLTVQWGHLDDELAGIAATPPEVVRAELESACHGGVVPEILRPLHDNPAVELKRVVEEMARYWDAVVAPVWPQVRALVMSDLFFRLEQFATHGLAAVVGQLHPEVRLEGDRLTIAKKHQCVQRYDLTGSGVLLVPCVFTWPTLLVMCCEVSQPSLTFPPRGVAALGLRDESIEQAEPLAPLLGRTRAQILATLAAPGTTTHLARVFEISPAAISQHLKVLKTSGLVEARRRGRVVLYQRTAAAAALLAAGAPPTRAG
jgi:DNA-binding transcriptional ArsR family regulator